MTGDGKESLSVDDAVDGPGGHFSDTTTDCERRSECDHPSKQRRRHRRHRLVYRFISENDGHLTHLTFAIRKLNTPIILLFYKLKTFDGVIS